MIGGKWIVELWQRARLQVIVVSLVLLSVGAFVGYWTVPDSEVRLREFLLAVGSAALSGGVFAWLTKLAQLGGVFRDELERIIYGKKYLSRRADSVEMWLNATRSLYEPRFPELVNRLDESALRAVLPTDRRFFLRDARRVVTLSPATGKPGWISVSQKMEATLVTEAGRGKVERTSYFEFPEGAYEAGAVERMIENQRSSYFPAGTTRADARECTRDEILDKKYAENGSCLVTFGARLDAGTVYVVRDEWSDEQDTAVDNVISFIAASYVDGLEVVVSYPPESMIVQFHALGGAQFSDVRPPTPGVSIHKSAEQLLFSDAGFLLTMQLK